MKRAILIVVALALVLCAGCTPYSELVPETPQDVLDVAMYVIRGGTSAEPLILGADGTPAALTAPTGLAAQISQQLSYEIVSIEENGDTASAVLNITAPNAVDLVYQSLVGMETYDEEAFTAEMEKLLADSPAAITYTVEITLLCIDGVWCMQINEAFSNAITGGLMNQYAEVQQAIIDAFTKGGEQ